MRLKLSFGLLLLIDISMAVDKSKFRTCMQTSFCRRHRSSKPLISYSLDADSIRFLPCKEKSNEKKEEEKTVGSSFWNKMFSKKKIMTGDLCNNEMVKGP